MSTGQTKASGATWPAARLEQPFGDQDLFELVQQVIDALRAAQSVNCDLASRLFDVTARLEALERAAADRARPAMN